MSSKSKKSTKHSTKKDSSSSDAKSSKSKSKSKSSSSSNSKEIAAAQSKILKLATSKPKHYTSRRVASKLKDDYSSEIVRAAIANLQGAEKIDFERKDGGKRGEKGQYVIVPLRKAA